MIGSDVGRVSIEILSHLEDSSSISIFFPEVFRNLRNSVNSNSFEAIGLNSLLNPILKVASDITVFLGEIRKVSKSTVFNLVLILPVFDVTVAMVMFTMVERINLVKVITDRSYMVSNDIDHNPNSSLTTGANKVLEIVSRSKMVVELLPVASPVPMVTSIQVINNRRNPNGIEAHSRDVIKVVSNSLVSTSTVVS